MTLEDFKAGKCGCIVENIDELLKLAEAADKREAIVRMANAFYTFGVLYVWINRDDDEICWSFYMDALCIVFVRFKSLSEAVKPPLGVEPAYVWLDKRIQELASAISRYVQAGLKPKDEWIFELEARKYERSLYESKSDLQAGKK